MKSNFFSFFSLVIFFITLNGCDRVSDQLITSSTIDYPSPEEAKEAYSKSNLLSFEVIWEAASNVQNKDGKKILLVPFKKHKFQKLEVGGQVFETPVVFVGFYKDKDSILMKEVIIATSKSQKMLITEKNLSKKSQYETIQIFNKKGEIEENFIPPPQNGRPSSGCSVITVYQEIYISNKTGVAYPSGGVSIGTMDICPGGMGGNYGSPYYTQSFGSYGYAQGYINYLMYQFNNLIDYSELRPSWRPIVENLKQISNYAIGGIIRKFSVIPGMILLSPQGDNFGAIPGQNPNWNWKIKEGDVGPAASAGTGYYKPAQHVIITTLSDVNNNNASDLSIARTLIHESVHAYLIAYFTLEENNAKVEFADLFGAFRNSKDANMADLQHEEYTRSFVDQIAAALKEVSQMRGHNINDDQFFNDMAWAGLQTTTAFSKKSPEEQRRIFNVGAIEFTGYDMDNNPQPQRGRRP